MAHWTDWDKAYWILPTYNLVDDVHALELKAIADLKLSSEQVETDEFGPAFYADKRDAERVRQAILRAAPNVTLQILPA